jgi:sortase A
LSDKIRRMSFTAKLGFASVAAGLLLLGYLGWMEYGTGIGTAAAQREARAAFAAMLQKEAPEVHAAELQAAADPAAWASDNPTFAPRGEEQTRETPQEAGDEAEEPIQESATVAYGSPFARIVAPAAGLDAIVFEGVDPGTLTRGPGHMPETPLPGDAGNGVISGHRTTYGAPFNELDELEPGDVITVERVGGTHTFIVREAIIVAPTDVWVAEHRDGTWLTLTTCHPEGSARQRLVVFAEQTKAVSR